MRPDREVPERRVPALLVLASVVSAAVFLTALVITVLAPSADDGAADVDRVAALQDEVDDDDRAKAASEVIETFEVFGAKNPFERPLSFDIPDTTIGDPTAPSTSTPEGALTDPAESTTTTEVAPSRGTRVQLLEIFETAEGTVANLVVDSELYEEVAEGEVFADVFLAVSLDVTTQCGDFLMGDVDFELCVGQEILK